MDVVRNTGMFEEFRRLSGASESDPFHMRLCGISHCDESYRIVRENSDINVFEYILQGTGTVISNGSRHTASEGDVYMLLRGSNHTYYSDGEHPWTKIWFNVDGPLVDSLVRVYGLESTVCIGGCPVGRQFREFIDMVRPEDPPEEVVIRCSVKFHEILALIAGAAASKREPGSQETRLLKRYIENNIHRSVTLAELAALIYCSESQMIRIFKRETNRTPYAYLLEKKMEMAGTLLKNTRMTVKEIADYLGYSDQHYFSNQFKQHRGICPLQFRNER